MHSTSLGTFESAPGIFYFTPLLSDPLLTMSYFPVQLFDRFMGQLDELALRQQQRKSEIQERSDQDDRECEELVRGWIEEAEAREACERSAHKTARRKKREFARERRAREKREHALVKGETECIELDNTLAPMECESARAMCTPALEKCDPAHEERVVSDCCLELRERAEEQLHRQQQRAVWLRKKYKLDRREPVALYYRLYKDSQQNRQLDSIEWDEIQTLLADLVVASPIVLPLYVRPLTKADVVRSFCVLSIPEAVLCVLESEHEPFGWSDSKWHELLNMKVDPYFECELGNDFEECYAEEDEAYFLTSTELLLYLRRNLFPSVVQCNGTAVDHCNGVITATVSDNYVEDIIHNAVVNVEIDLFDMNGSEMFSLFSEAVVQSDSNVHVSLFTDESFSMPDEKIECDISVTFQKDELVDCELVDDLKPTGVDFVDALGSDDLFGNRLIKSTSPNIQLCVHVITVLNSFDFSYCCSINVESVKPDAIVSGNTSACLDDIKSDVHFVDQGGEQSFETHVSDNGFIFTFPETSHGNASDNFEFESGNQTSDFEYLKNVVSDFCSDDNPEERVSNFHGEP